MKSWPIFSTPKHKAGLLFRLVLLAGLSALLNICLGPVFIAPAEVLRVLLGNLSGTPEAQIVLLARLPRVCGCLLAGTALALSGAVIQSVLDNPLASPNIIGVNSGAGFMGALCGALLPGAPAMVPAAAFLGALAGVLLVLFTAERSGASRITLVLAGIAISNVFSAGIDAVVTFVPDALNHYSDFRIGGLSNLSMAQLHSAFWISLAAAAVVLSLSNELDVLLLGADTAQSLGLPVKPLRLILLALAAALAGAAVSFSGLLGFVGLIVPHIMRRLAGGSSAVFLTASAIGGAITLSLCDLLARLAFAPYELPVGIVLSLAGGPFFIWLLLRQRGGRTHD